MPALSAVCFTHVTVCLFVINNTLGIDLIKVYSFYLKYFLCVVFLMKYEEKQSITLCSVISFATVNLCL
jgi:hypothetical protein